jgi:hypothetical protein
LSAAQEDALKVFVSATLPRSTRLEVGKAQAGIKVTSARKRLPMDWNRWNAQAPPDRDRGRVAPRVGAVPRRGSRNSPLPVAACQIRFEPQERHQFALAAPRRRSASISRRLSPPNCAR